VREKAMPLCLIPQIPHNLRDGTHHYCLGKDPEIPQKRDMRESYKGISEFYLKICKNSRAIVDQEQETWRLNRPFYLLIAQDTSDGCKPHGGR
jgi:hypothetical protein